ncbi:MAG: hypothetical protein AAFZ11_00790 [Pseudomonadota bacterium]
MSGRLDDTGFADPRAALAIVRRMKIRARLDDARASTEALLKLLQKTCQERSSERSAVGEQAVRLGASDEAGGRRGVRIAVSEADAMRERELLEGVDLILDLMDHLGAGIGQGLFSAVGAPEDMGAPESGHSLCGGAK